MAADEVAAMLADLGISRRDLVSAPEDRKKELTAREQKELQQHVAARRAQMTSATNNGKHAEKIRAWNTAELNFEPDEITSLLENRYDGQGHRLKRQGQYDEKAEVLDNKFSEERRMYLQEHGGRSPVFSSPVNGGGRSRGRGPAARNMLDQQNSAAHASATATRRQNDWALSPSAFGRTRFVRDQVVNQTSQRASKGAGGPVAPVYRIAATASSDQNVMHAPAVQSPRLAPPSKAIPIREPSPSAHSQASGSTRSRNSRRHGFRGFPGSKNFDRLRSLKPTTPNTLPALDNPAIFEAYRMRALWYAANPGLESDVYHKRYPDRKPFLDWAFKKLIQEVILLLKNGDQRDLVHYLETHPDRQWMVDAAKEARTLIESSTPEDIEKYCGEHPEHEAFVRFAASHFTAATRRDSIIDTEASESNGLPSTTKMSADAPQLDGFHSDGTQAEMTTSEPQHLSSSQNSEDIQMADAELLLTETLASVPKAKQPIETNAATTTLSTRARGAMTSNVEPLGSSSPSNGVSKATTETVPSSPPPAGKIRDMADATPAKASENQGRLDATFFDSDGQFLGIHQMGVPAPVAVNVSVSSRSVAFDPRGLIEQITSLAQSMVERTNAATGPKLVAYESDDEDL